MFGVREKKILDIQTGQSQLSIPKAIAEALGWEHQTTIKIEIKTVEGKIGLFLTKKENKSD